MSVRDLNLTQLNWFNTGIEASGIAAGPNNDVYLSAKNHIYNFDVNGNLLRDMTFPSSSIEYTDVTVLCDKVYASYRGSQHGFTVRDLQLNQQSSTEIGREISGIAAGPNADLYLTSANHIYNYSTSGALIRDMDFPVSSINYSGVSVVFNTLT